MLDPETTAELQKLYIDPQSVPPGAVRLLYEPTLIMLGVNLKNEDGEKLKWWAKTPNNSPALAYQIETEHKPGTGLLIRNLFEDERKSRRTISWGDGPPWHAFAESLEASYKSGVAIFVEGPKDARALISNNVPAIAIMGLFPSREHFRVIRRYVKAIIWIQDNDPNPTQEQIVRAEKVRKAASYMGLGWYPIKPLCKDPGEMNKPGNERAKEKLLREINDLRRVLSYVGT